MDNMARHLNGNVESTEQERDVKRGSICVTSFCDLDINMPWGLTHRNCILVIRCIYVVQNIFRIKILHPLAALTDREVEHEFLNIT
jgi:hypothetical protein